MRDEVVEVRQLLGELLLDVRQLEVEEPVTVGDAVGWQWSVAGRALGWVPAPWAGLLRMSPPLLSEVRCAPRSVVDVPTAWLPEGEGLVLGEGVHRVGGLHVVVRRIPRPPRVAGRPPTDRGFLGGLAAMVGLGAVVAVVLGTSPRAPEASLIEDPLPWVARFELPPPEVKPPVTAPSRSQEGAKAAGEEGKVGKPDAALTRARGVARAADRAAAGVAGVLGAWDLVGSALGGAVDVGPIGGLLGAKGAQIGSSGLSSRGGSLGGGGERDDLGGLGTRGPGSGERDYGEGEPGPGKEVRALVAPQDAIVMGGLPADLIDAVIKRRLPAIRACFQRALQSQPDLGGKLTVRFVIARDGSVSSVGRKEDAVGDPRVGDCVEGLVFGLRFPEPQGGVVVVSYPFLFQAG